MKTRVLKSFPSGHCQVGFHKNCRGAYYNPGGKEKTWYCDCKCHQGKKLSEPEPDKPRVLNPRLDQRAQDDKWVSECIIHTHIEIPIPDQTKVSTLQARINRASIRAGVRITTRPIEGVLHCRVAKNQTRKTKKGKSG